MAKHWAFSSERFDEILEYKTGKKKYNEKIEEHPEEVWVEVLDDCRSSYFMLLSTFPQNTTQVNPIVRYVNNTGELISES